MTEDELAEIRAQTLARRRKEALQRRLAKYAKVLALVRAGDVQGAQYIRSRTPEHAITADPENIRSNPKCLSRLGKKRPTKKKTPARKLLKNGMTPEQFKRKRYETWVATGKWISR